MFAYNCRGEMVGGGGGEVGPGVRKVSWPGVLVLVAPSEKVLVAAPQMVGHGAGAAPSSQQQIHFCCQTPNTLLFAKFEIHF